MIRLAFLGSIFSLSLVWAVDRVVVWDGDVEGASASGWAAPKGQSKVSKESGAGVSGGVGIRFTAHGSGWAGFGWNWAGWTKNPDGPDLKSKSNLIFKIKITAPNRDAVPMPDAFTVQLATSIDGKKTEKVVINEFTRTLLDGKWHELRSPLTVFLASPDVKDFPWNSVWEIDLGAYDEEDVSYTVEMDDIAFE